MDVDKALYLSDKTATRQHPFSHRLFFWTLTSSLAGFLFGFDTVVISGAEQKIQSLWNLSPEMHGLAIGSALYGTVIGSLLGAWPSDRFGRRTTLLWIGIFYLLSAIGTALSTNVYVFIAARALGGLGIGISTVVAPLYIAEISPPEYRGRLTGLFQFNIVFGIVVAFASNAALGLLGEHAWRWMLGIVALPSLVYTYCCFKIPESPRWLLGQRNDRPGGLAVLQLIQPDAPAKEIEAKAAAILSESSTAHAEGHIHKPPPLSKPLLLAVLIAFFNQLSGINAILYFAPRIFAMTGLSQEAALLQSVGIGLINLVFTLAGLWLIDRLGRKTLLYIGSIGYIVSLGATAWAFYTEHYGIVPACIFAFIASHAIGQGTVIWVYISEIFPTKYRAKGQTVGSFTHWILAALLTSFFPIVVSLFEPGAIFLFFCIMMVIQLIWVQAMVVETKSVPLEQMGKRLGWS